MMAPSTGSQNKTSSAALMARAAAKVENVQNLFSAFQIDG